MSAHINTFFLTHGKNDAKGGCCPQISRATHVDAKYSYPSLIWLYIHGATPKLENSYSFIGRQRELQE